MHVFLSHGDGLSWKCPECEKECVLYDHQPERRWRHLDTCQYKTILDAEPPRADCAEHGPRPVKLPWAEARSRFTLLFERLAIEWLRHASQKVVPEILHLPWDEIHCIMDRAVVRGLARREAEPVGLIGVAEKSHRKRHNYFTLVNDIGRSRVLHIGDDRNQTSLDGFWSTLTEEQRQAVEAVALDMWDPYIASIRTHLPDADDKMVFHKFHIARHPGEAVDKI